MICPYCNGTRPAWGSCPSCAPGQDKGLPMATAKRETGQSGIYMASKTRHADRWKALRASGVPIISTWIDEAGPGESTCLTDLWRRCIEEARSAAALVVYREPGENLKGAFVEVGAALSAGVPVYAVGMEEFSVVNHRLVECVPELDNAIRAALGLASETSLEQNPPNSAEGEENGQ